MYIGIHLCIYYNYTYSYIEIYNLYIVLLSNTTYMLQVYGQDEISIGMNLTIQCMVMELGSPVETNDIHVYMCLALPTGEVIIEREFNTVAMLEHNGTYSCIAYFNGALTVVSLPVIVYGEL